MLTSVTLAEPNGHTVLNGDASHSYTSAEASHERVQIINDEKQFTYVLPRFRWSAANTLTGQT